MEVKNPIAQIPVPTLAKYQRSVQVLHRTIILSSPLFPDDIIDCGVIETDKRSQTYTRIVNYNYSSYYLVNGKGKIIDVRV